MSICFSKRLCHQFLLIVKVILESKGDEKVMVRYCWKILYQVSETTYSFFFFVGCGWL